MLFINTILSSCLNNNNFAYKGQNRFSGNKKEFVNNIGNYILFDFNSYLVKDEYKNILNKQAYWLNQYAHYIINIEGHADERGTREYNLALGQRRAVAVKNYLIDHGISSNRIKTISYGQEKPKELCDEDFCWSKNRRAVIIIN